MRRLPLMFALAAVTLLALPAVASAADPTPVPVVDPSAVPPTDPTILPVVDPTPDPAVTPTEDPTTVSPGDPGATPAEPPVACAPDDPSCIIPIVGVPLPCPEGSEVCAMGGGVPVTGPGASDQPLVAPGPLPAGGMFFSITKIADGTTSYDVQGSITMGPDGLTATVGCNTIAAPATWDAEKNLLTVTGVAVSTKMACMGDPGAAEALLVQLLGAGTVTFDGTTLTGAGITADAMIAMADGVAPLTLGGPVTVGSGAGSGEANGAVTGTDKAAAVPAAPVAATPGAEGAASMMLLVMVAALLVFLVAGGLFARRVTRQR